MKKVFTSKLFCLIFLVLVNISLLLVIFVVINKKFEYPTEYISEEVLDRQGTQTVLTKYYTVQRGNINVSENRDASIFAYDDMYTEVLVDNVTISKYSEIESGQKLGTLNGNVVSAEHKSFCLDIIEEATNYKILLYNYNHFSIKLPISVKEYIQDRVNKVKSVDVYLDGVKCNVAFSEYDMTDFQSNNVLYAVFKPTNSDFLVSRNASVKCEFVLETISNVFYIDAAAFDYNIQTSKFYIIDNEKSKEVLLLSKRIIRTYAIIDDSTSGLVYEGLKLYVD